MTPPPSEVSDPSKKLRNLRKKLRDIEALQERIDSGELKSPDPDQLDKISRRTVVESEIRELEDMLKRL